MKLLNVDIYKLVTFSFSNITRLEIDFDTESQIIIGTNGSGKTHLINQLSLLPPTRTEYEKNGYNYIKFEHNRSIYEISSDFKEKTSPHKFMKDNVELNVSGSTEVQLELLKEHIGYNKNVNSILFNAVDIVRMRPGDRKKYLLENNPVNLGFLLTLHKKINSYVKGLNTTLKLLEDRKNELLSKLLSDEEYVVCNKTKNKCEKNLNFYMNRITELETIINLKNSDTVYSNIDLKQYVKELRILTNNKLRVYNQYLLDTGENTLNNKSVYDETVKRLHQTQGKINNTLSQMTDLNSDILLLEQKLEELNPISTLSDIDNNIQMYQNEYDSLQDYTLEYPLSKHILSQESHIYNTVDRVIDSVRDVDVVIYSNNKIQQKENHLRHYSDVASNVNESIKEIKYNLKELYPQVKDFEIPNPCSKMKCPLYKQYIDNRTSIKNRVEFLENKLETLNRKYTRLDVYLTQQKQQLDTIRYYLYRLQPLLRLCDDFVFLKSIINVTDLGNFVYAPLVVKSKIVDMFVMSKNTYKQMEIKTKLDELISQQNKQHAIIHENKSFIQKDLTNKYNKLSELNMMLLQYQQSVDSDQLYTISYDDRQQHITLLQNKLHEYKKYVEDSVEHNKQQLLKSELDYLYQAKREHTNKLSNITVTLNEQDSIKDRLNNEILIQIGNYTKLKAKLSDISYVVNKIPIEQTITFVNTIISQMNNYMNIVFTYDFYILPLASDANDIDYTFKIQIGDIVVPDISSCSGAQKEMINLAFNLTMRNILKINDYPLFLDECGNEFDTTHKQRLLILLQHLLENNLISQLFIVNHNSLIHEGLNNARTLVLNSENVLTPPTFNENVAFNRKK